MTSSQVFCACPKRYLCRQESKYLRSRQTAQGDYNQYNFNPDTKISTYDGILYPDTSSILPGKYSDAGKYAPSSNNNNMKVSLGPMNNVDKKKKRKVGHNVNKYSRDCIIPKMVKSETRVLESYPFLAKSQSSGIMWQGRRSGLSMECNDISDSACYDTRYFDQRYEVHPNVCLLKHTNDELCTKIIKDLQGDIKRQIDHTCSSDSKYLKLISLKQNTIREQATIKSCNQYESDCKQYPDKRHRKKTDKTPKAKDNRSSTKQRYQNKEMSDYVNDSKMNPWQAVQKVFARVTLDQKYIKKKNGSYCNKNNTAQNNPKSTSFSQTTLIRDSPSILKRISRIWKKDESKIDRCCKQYCDPGLIVLSQTNRNKQVKKANKSTTAKTWKGEIEIGSVQNRHHCDKNEHNTTQVNSIYLYATHKDPSTIECEAEGRFGPLCKSKVGTELRINLKKQNKLNNKTEIYLYDSEKPTRITALIQSLCAKESKNYYNRYLKTQSNQYDVYRSVCTCKNESCSKKGEKLIKYLKKELCVQSKIKDAKTKSPKSKIKCKPDGRCGSHCDPKICIKSHRSYDKEKKYDKEHIKSKVTKKSAGYSSSSCSKSQATYLKMDTSKQSLGRNKTLNNTPNETPKIKLGKSYFKKPTTVNKIDQCICCEIQKRCADRDETTISKMLKKLKNQRNIYLKSNCMYLIKNKLSELHSKIANSKNKKNKNKPTPPLDDKFAEIDKKDDKLVFENTCDLTEDDENITDKQEMNKPVFFAKDKLPLSNKDETATKRNEKSTQDDENITDKQEINKRVFFAKDKLPISNKDETATKRNEKSTQDISKKDDIIDNVRVSTQVQTVPNKQGKNKRKKDKSSKETTDITSKKRMNKNNPPLDLSKRDDIIKASTKNAGDVNEKSKIIIEDNLPISSNNVNDKQENKKPTLNSNNQEKLPVPRKDVEDKKKKKKKPALDYSIQDNSHVSSKDIKDKKKNKKSALDGSNQKKVTVSSKIAKDKEGKKKRTLDESTQNKLPVSSEDVKDKMGKIKPTLDESTQDKLSKKSSNEKNRKSHVDAKHNEKYKKPSFIKRTISKLMPIDDMTGALDLKINKKSLKIANIAEERQYIKKHAKKSHNATIPIVKCVHKKNVPRGGFVIPGLELYDYKNNNICICNKKCKSRAKKKNAEEVKEQCHCTKSKCRNKSKRKICSFFKSSKVKKQANDKKDWTAAEKKEKGNVEENKLKKYRDEVKKKKEKTADGTLKESSVKVKKEREDKRDSKSTDKTKKEEGIKEDSKRTKVTDKSKKDVGKKGDSKSTKSTSKDKKGSGIKEDSKSTKSTSKVENGSGIKEDSKSTKSTSKEKKEARMKEDYESTNSTDKVKKDAGIKGKSKYIKLTSKAKKEAETKGDSKSTKSTDKTMKVGGNKKASKLTELTGKARKEVVSKWQCTDKAKTEEGNDDDDKLTDIHTDSKRKKSDGKSIDPIGISVQSTGERGKINKNEKEAVQKDKLYRARLEVGKIAFRPKSKAEAKKYDKDNEKCLTRTKECQIKRKGASKATTRKNKPLEKQKKPDNKAAISKINDSKDRMKSANIQKKLDKKQNFIKRKAEVREAKQKWTDADGKMKDVVQEKINKMIDNKLRVEAEIKSKKEAQWIMKVKLAKVEKIRKKREIKEHDNLFSAIRLEAIGKGSEKTKQKIHFSPMNTILKQTILWYYKIWHKFQLLNRYRKRVYCQRKRKQLANCDYCFQALRKKPCVWIYYCSPWLYPTFLRLRRVLISLGNMVMYFLACLIWTPCVLLTEVCRFLFCFIAC